MRGRRGGPNGGLLRRLVERSIATLPSPRDEAARNLLRSIRDLVSGRPHRVSSILERRLVEQGWLLVDAYERLGTRKAGQVFAHEIKAWYAYARDTIENLEPWECGSGSLDIYENDNNRLRFRRTLDFVLPGDRIFDVGFGRGYLCGLLLRDGDVEAYHGIDVEPEFLSATESMLEANGLMGREVDVRLGNLFELDRRKLQASRPSLVICCEVLEHLNDPERALVTLANALPPDTDLLFSVPLHGRLESVWGHVTVFDVNRLRSMIKRARLTVHHVEPVANTWVLVVASRERAPNQRVLRQSSRPPRNVSRPLVHTYDFVDIDPGEITSVRYGDTLAEARTVDGGWVECKVNLKTSEPIGAKDRAGLTFPVDGLAALRIEVSLLDFDPVRVVRVRALSDKKVVGLWSWRPLPKQLKGRRSRRFSLRPGESSPFFRGGAFEANVPVDHVQVLVEIEGADSCAFGLRAAYLPKEADVASS